MKRTYRSNNYYNKSDSQDSSISLQSKSMSLDKYFMKVPAAIRQPNDKKWTSPNNNGTDPSIASINQNILYPKNPEIRKYQLSIVRTCLFHNTLVCLPTGLGKTHIASVVMLNYYLAFPNSKIYFLAPTRPLVNQQKNSLAGFYQYLNRDHIIELNGSLGSKNRVGHYSNKRIFFLTPQTLDNDLQENRIQAKSTSLIIFAHRATGGYAYVNIVKNLDKLNIGYRIVGLSATPGNTLEQVQQVITNLHISRMQVKDQNDSDVKPYIHHKDIEAVQIKTTQNIRAAQKIIDQFMKKPVGIIVSLQAVQGYIINLMKLRGLNQGTYFQMMKSFKNNQQQHKQRLGSKSIGLIYASLKILKYLVDGKKTLREQGFESFNVFLKKFKQKRDQRTGKSIPFLQQIVQSKQYEQLQGLFQDNSCNHPKLKRLNQILQTYFSSKQSQQLQSKAIIFTHHRTSAMQIQRSLSQIPVVKPWIFVGQSKTVDVATNTEANTDSVSYIQMKQKQQIEVIRKFKQNELNTLISTSIGQQGLDIGQVDLIICYDNGMSPIRMVQRMGRTGRKRDGKVILLLMQGKEIQSYRSAIQRNKFLKNIIKDNSSGLKTSGKIKFEFYSFSSCMFIQRKQYQIQYINNEKIQIIQIDGEGQDQNTASKNIKTKQKRKLPKTKKKTKKQLKQQQKIRKKQQIQSKLQELKLKYLNVKDQGQSQILDNQQDNIYEQTKNSNNDQQYNEQQSDSQQQKYELNFDQQTKQILIFANKQSEQNTNFSLQDSVQEQANIDINYQEQEYSDKIIDQILFLSQVQDDN